jgi:hypothetical protein
MPQFFCFLVCFPDRVSHFFPHWLWISVLLPPPLDPLGPQVCTTVPIHSLTFWMHVLSAYSISGTGLIPGDLQESQTKSWVLPREQTDRQETLRRCDGAPNAMGTRGGLESQGVFQGRWCFSRVGLISNPRGAEGQGGGCSSQREQQGQRPGTF